MCEHVLGIEPAAENEKPTPRDLKLGSWIGNQRSRAAALSAERVERLSAIGMRWA
ncbi:helicase associated domain-containing protein [Streptomyces sp. NPDC001606]